MLRKNMTVPLAITDLTHEGNGVGRCGELPVFVPATAPGDEITARIVKVCKRFAFGVVEEIRTPSPRRIGNDCPVFPRCGGCTLRHLDYAAELAAKEKIVSDNLRRIGGIDLSLEPILPSPLERRYRNKAQFPVRMAEGRVRTGYFAPRSHRLIPVEDCLLQPGHFAAICRAFCGFAEEQGLPPYDEEAHRGLLRNLNIRYAETTGETLVCVVVNAEELPGAEALARELEKVCPGRLSLQIGVNRAKTNVILGGEVRHLSGPPFIRDALCGVALRLSAQSFYQVNRQAAEALYRLANDYAALKPGEILLDLYCGIGSIGLSMAGQAGRVIGVETVPGAVEDARANAAENGVKNARFLCMDAEEAAKELHREGIRPDAVVLDPPRKGASEETLRIVAAMKPSRMVYISCNSATLARDLALLKELGYATGRGRAVDLFPRTSHIESCVLLERR